MFETTMQSEETNTLTRDDEKAPVVTDPSQSSASVPEEPGIQAQHSALNKMSQVLLAAEITTAPPQSSDMNIDQPTSVKRHASIEDLHSDTKRIRIEEYPNSSQPQCGGKAHMKLNACTVAETKTQVLSLDSLDQVKERGESAVVAKSSSTGNAGTPVASLEGPATPEGKGNAALSQDSTGDASATLVSPKTDNSRGPTTASSSNSSSASSITAQTTAQASAPADAPPPPLKATTMEHLHLKYQQELEYMLREFRKLERQLLGAKGNGVEESAGSRERREKLHSFIAHLDDTIRQIEVGCQLEAEGKSTTVISNEQDRQQVADSAALTNLNKEKEEEENVQKLEEHILANLLPVKVRLKKQLAAQQGATRNPIGMPAARPGLQPSTAAEKGKGTFAAIAEERRKQAEAARAAAQEQSFMSAAPAATSQFGKPLSGGGSSLTQKLHGSTLGSQQRTHGHGVGSEHPPVVDAPTTDSGSEALASTASRKILYAGMAPGSNQVQSGVSAASGVHDMIIESPDLKPPSKDPATVATTPPVKAPVVVVRPPPLPPPPPPETPPVTASIPPKGKTKPYNDPNLTEDERKKVRKERRKRKKTRELRRVEKERQRQLFLQQQAAQAATKGPAKKVGKVVKGAAGKKKGPRAVEYICALCSEAYTSSCDYNPWWALASHECPKCRKTQIPRIDITSPANAIEYHPALLAHAEEGGGDGGGVSAPPVTVVHPMNPRPFCAPTGAKNSALYPLSDSEEESDLSELSDTEDLSEDSEDSYDSDDDIPLTEGELAEFEVFGKEYDGPKLTPDEASRLLILMGHAQTCPGHHKSVKHKDCCNSVKYLMLHVRDCPGTTSTFDVCPFPWCRKVKHLLYHLIACPRPKDCAICSPIGTSQNLRRLAGLNDHRRNKQRERMKAVIAAAAAAAKAKSVPPKSAYPSKPAKPTTFRVPVVQKKTTVSKFKVPPAKLPPPGASRIMPLSRTKAGYIRPPTLIKPTNGVVVKSLVKPVGKSSVVVVKTRPQGPVGAKPTVAALPGVEVVEKSDEKTKNKASTGLIRAEDTARTSLALNTLEAGTKTVVTNVAGNPRVESVGVNPIAVEMASAIAATMTTDTTPASNSTDFSAALIKTESASMVAELDDPAVYFPMEEEDELANIISTTTEASASGATVDAAQSDETMRSAPRFPRVPSVVKGECADQEKEESGAKEVPPV